MKPINQPHWVLTEMADAQVSRAGIDLWSKIENRLILPSGKLVHKKTTRLLKRYTVALLVGVILLGSLACVPKVRAFAQDVIQRMGIAFQSTGSLDHSVQMAEAIPTTSDIQPPSLNQDELRQQVPFHLIEPTWLPAGLDYIRCGVVHYDPREWKGSGVEAEIYYSRMGSFEASDGLLFFEANDGPISSPPLLAEGRQKPVLVNGQPGYYVHGGWQNDGSGDPQTRYGDLLWDDQADDAYLTWTQEGITYLLEANNLNLGMDDLLRIAESVSNP